jgi:MFS family permease
MGEWWMNEASLRAARRSVIAVFFLHGVVFSTWVSRIPAIQESLALKPAVLGLALLGVAMGSVPALPVTGVLISRYGSRPVTIWSSYAFCFSLIGLALAPNALLLTMALVLYGAAAGVMDVSMNSHGAVIEGSMGKPIMASFHAFFSLGGMAGAAVGGLIAKLGVPVFAHFAGASVVFAAATAASVGGMLPASVDRVPHQSGFAKLTRPLLALGVLSFCFLLSEGAVADWTAIYLRDALNANAGTAALGYAVFSAMMTLGRFLGDWLTAKLGPLRLLRAGSVLAACGLSGALLAPAPAIAMVGLAAVGAGFSVIVPLIFSAAGRAGGEGAGRNIAAVSTTGYFGFLVGPPLIGFLAGAYTLRAALWLLVGFSLMGTFLARSVNNTRVKDQDSANPPSTNSSVPTM